MAELKAKVHEYRTRTQLPEASKLDHAGRQEEQLVTMRDPRQTNQSGSPGELSCVSEAILTAKNSNFGCMKSLRQG
jgi:hypothetical protein